MFVTYLANLAEMNAASPKSLEYDDIGELHGGCILYGSPMIAANALASQPHLAFLAGDAILIIVSQSSEPCCRHHPEDGDVWVSPGQHAH